MTDTTSPTTAAGMMVEFHEQLNERDEWFAPLHIDPAVEIPEWPADARRPSSWSTRYRFLHPNTGPFRITADRELQERQPTHRKMTADEKQAYAEKHGFDSWEAIQDLYDDNDFWTTQETPGDLPFLRPTGIVEADTEWVLADEITSLSFHARMPVEPLDDDQWTDGEPDPDEYLDAPVAAWTATVRDGTVVDIEFEGEKDAPDDAESPF